MIKVYYLKTERIEGTDTVEGIQFIHYAVLGVEGVLRKLIQDTTVAEDTGLSAVAVETRKATAGEIAQLESSKAMMSGEPARNLLAEMDELKAKVDILMQRRG
jgi:hypothetical protein